uniref:Uncharacterized protein n=1 Tax=Nelumbo nucifera TaxID=4432 RepID=A0A822Y7F2_NELNU|nr:TPA_asm: hypothetical protein HUJ06_029640 [Nelumbo nucifera]
MEEGFPESMKMERQLREAALPLQGNAESLSDLLEKDNPILDRVTHEDTLRFTWQQQEGTLNQDSGLGLCLARDTDGMIPLHLAAIEGQVDAIKELVMEKRGTVLQLVGRGETILYLCVKHGSLNVLEQPLDLMSNPDKFVNVGDADGNTTVSAFFCSRQAG